MIQECVLWRGFFTSTYQEDIDKWIKQNKEFDVTTIHCSEQDSYNLAVDFLEEESLFSDIVVLFIGIEKWTINDTVSLLDHCSQLDSSVRLGLVWQHGGTSTQRIDHHITDYRNRGIPYDPDEMSDWIVQWAKERDVRIAHQDALEVAHYVGYDVNALVDGLLALSHGTSGSIQRDVLLDYFKLGEREVWDLTNYIVDGNRAGTAETMIRLERYSPLYLLSILMNRFRAYVALTHDVNSDVSCFGVSNKARKYVVAEARRLTQNRSVKGLRYITKVDIEIKSGKNALSQQEELKILVDRLARLFK